MTQWIYHNGNFLPESAAVLPVTDRSYLFGEGLFETMRVTRGQIPWLPEHLERLRRGMERLDFTMELSDAHLAAALTQTLERNSLEAGILRLTLSRQNAGLDSFEPGEIINLVIFPRSLPEKLSTWQTQGLHAVFYTQWSKRPEPLDRIKSTDYLEYLQAKAYAGKQGAEEALILDAEQAVIEGAVSNLFVFAADRWVTPPLRQGPLPGVTRRVILNLFREQQIPHEEAPVPRALLEKSPEAFLSNAAWELLPLTRLEGKPVGRGTPGEHTRILQDLFRRELERRLAGDYNTRPPA